MLRTRRLLPLALLAGCGLPLGQPAVAQTTERVSVSSFGGQANGLSLRLSTSADGRSVAFSSFANNLVADDTNNREDVFVRDRVAGATERVSIDSDEGQADGHSDTLSISASGRFVAFDSNATNLVGGGFVASIVRIYVRDRRAGATELVSADGSGTPGNGSSFRPSISANGRFVAFDSSANNLVAGDTNTWPDVFVRDRQSGTTELVSMNTGGLDPGNAPSKHPSISANGRFVAFDSSASNLVAGDANNADDVFVRDRQTGTTELVSVNTGGLEPGNGRSEHPSISADGRFVAFASRATDLARGMPLVAADNIFVRDLQAGTTEWVSRPNTWGDPRGPSQQPSISADGRFVAFHSLAHDLVAGDTNEAFDVFVHDRLTGLTERVSVRSSGGQANQSSGPSSISADGRRVAFYSLATNLVAGDTNLTGDIFLRDRGKIEDNAPNDLVVKFADGLWQRLNNAPWKKISDASPTASQGGDLDGDFTEEFIAGFLGPGPKSRGDSEVGSAAASGAGLWARYNNASWVRLHNTPPKRIVTGDLDGDGMNELIVDFGSNGLWVRRESKKPHWVKLHDKTTVALATGDLDGNGKDDLIVSFGGLGLRARMNNARWTKLHDKAPSRIVTGDLDGDGSDELIADFGSTGLWVRRESKKPHWVKLHDKTTVALATGDLDGNGKDDLIVSFGGLGLRARMNNAWWTKLHDETPSRIVTGDLDQTGKAEVVVDLGAAGLWARYNNAVWKRLHRSSARDLVAGYFD